MKIGGHILDNLEATFACEWLKSQFLIILDLVSTHFLENFYTCKIKDPQNFQNGSVPLTPLLEKVTRCNKGGIGKKVEVSVGSSLARFPSLFFCILMLSIYLEYIVSNSFDWLRPRISVTSGRGKFLEAKFASLG